MKPLRWLIILGASFLTMVSGAYAETYDYPITNPYAATVVGTPKAFRAQLPRDVQVKTFELTVFEDRAVPDLLWYNEDLQYSLAYQDYPAPLVFVIAGTGAGYRSPKMQMLQRAFYQAGFHVLSLPSPTHPNFIVAASQTGIPGHLQEDSRDLYRVMELAWEQVQDRIEVTQFYLTGYSLGGTQAAFVSKLDSEKGLFNFNKVLLINPSVSLYNSTQILDDMLTKNLSPDPSNVNRFFDRMFHAFSEVYRHGDFLDFSGDFLYAAYKERHPPEGRIATLIGISFRMSSASMVFTSDVFTDSGYIKPKSLNLSTSDSITDYYKVSARVSFINYFDELFLPYFQAQDPTLTRQKLIDTLSLKSIEHYLQQARHIWLVTNADELILAPGELEYLRRLFGPRAKIYPLGGHCGNIDYKDNIAYMIRTFSH